MSESLRDLLGNEIYTLALAALQARTPPTAIQAADLNEAERVALHIWTLDTGKDAWFQQINRALLGDNAAAISRLAPLIGALRSGLDKLPSFVGVCYRGVKERYFPAGEFERFIAAHEPGRVVDYKGFTGASQSPERKLRGRVQLVIQSLLGKAIGPLSSKPEQAEVLFRDGARFNVERREIKPNGVIEIWLIQQAP